MSRKRKPNHAKKIQARIARKLGDVPPPSAVEAYTDAFTRANAAPEQYAQITALGQDEIDQLVAGIAAPEKFGLPPDGDEVAEIAESIRDWHILNGVLFVYDWWPKPIATMSVEEIIKQIRRDREVGRFPQLDEIPDR